MTRRATALATIMVALLVAAVLVGTEVLASTSASSPRPAPQAPVAATPSGGNAHSDEVRAWVACKAEKGKAACVKPTPPGRALGHGKKAGEAHGPASADGRGYGWGRAHAPGQVKAKEDKAQPRDEQS